MIIKQTKSRFLLLLMVAISTILSSCAKTSTTQFIPEACESKTDHSISLEQALATLEDYLDLIPTKSKASARTIGDIFIVGGKSIATKSSSTRTGNLLYLVNFEGDNGYAVLPADDRILDDMLALVDKGYITDEEFSSELALEHRVSYEYYPQTGDGYYTVLEDGELNYYINPNTFQLYDSSEEDCFVGNFSNEMANADTLAVLDTLMAPMPIKLSQMILDYADECISNYIVVNLDTADVNAPMLDDSLNLDSQDPNPANHKYRTEIEVLRDDITNVNNMLYEFEFWNQDYPFNALCPYVKQFILLGPETQAGCGCVNLAAGKILSYFQYPNVLEYNGFRINWDKLYPVFMWGDGGESNAAYLMYMLGTWCNSLYFFGGTFTFPSYLASLLSTFGYPDVDYNDYDTETVIEALDNGCPVFICSIPKEGFLNYDLGNSHAWNIDGYMSRRKSIITRQYLDGYLMNRVQTNHDTILVHCDWGWGGNSNGYFVSGIFDLSADNLNLDEGVRRGRVKSNYNWYLKTITYDNPYE